MRFKIPKFKHFQSMSDSPDLDPLQFCQYSKMRIGQLKALLYERGLDSDFVGTRNEIIRRLCEDDKVNGFSDRSPRKRPPPLVSSPSPGVSEPGEGPLTSSPTPRARGTNKIIVHGSQIMRGTHLSFSNFIRTALRSWIALSGYLLHRRHRASRYMFVNRNVLSEHHGAGGGWK
jgi:hypothetical protein